MEKGRIEKSHEISPLPTRIGHGGDIYIPLGLQVEILKKLPAKSLVRFQSVSKQWSSIITSCRDFIESIVTRSLTQPPRDAYIFHEFGKCFLALSSATDKEAFSVPMSTHQPVRGLICCWVRFNYVAAIYNPTTRQSFYLPEVKIPEDTYGSFLFGYDPLENQYKVVFLPVYNTGKNCQVFTLGDGMAKQWRTIQGYFGYHLENWGVVCINGTIYYQEKIDGYHISKLISFDVRSEIFYHVEAPIALLHNYSSTLINYQGKLGFICCKEGVQIWVMETQGWSKIFFYEIEGFDQWWVSGATRDGEIVFDKYKRLGYVYGFHTMYCVYYYDPKRNSMRYVDVEDYYTKARSRSKYIHFESVVTIPDHVNNTMCLK